LCWRISPLLAGDRRSLPATSRHAWRERDLDKLLGTPHSARPCCGRHTQRWANQLPHRLLGEALDWIPLGVSFPHQPPEVGVPNDRCRIEDRLGLLTYDNGPMNGGGTQAHYVLDQPGLISRQHA